MPGKEESCQPTIKDVKFETFDDSHIIFKAFVENINFEGKLRCSIAFEVTNFKAGVIEIPIRVPIDNRQYRSEKSMQIYLEN